MKYVLALLFTAYGVMTFYCPLVNAADTNCLAQQVMRIRSGDSRERALGQQELISSVRETVASLRGILRNAGEDADRTQWTDETSTINLAIHILGILRSVEAVDDLLDNLTPTKEQTRLNPPFGPGQQPAFKALATIGKLATPRIIERLTTPTQDDSIVDLCALLLVIEGKDRAAQLIRDCSTNAQGVAAENLKKALKQISCAEPSAGPTGESDEVDSAR